MTDPDPRRPKSRVDSRPDDVPAEPPRFEAGHPDRGEAVTRPDAVTLESEPPPRRTDRVAILGATGSIGTATVDVIRHLAELEPDRGWRAWAVSGHRNRHGLEEIVRGAGRAPKRVILSGCEAPNGNSRVAAAGVSSSDDPDELANFVGERGAEMCFGPEALVEAASHPEVDTVVAAIVGRAGLESSLAAVDAGKRVALANKETLVVAGPVVRRRLGRSGAELIPVDSEHSAIFQCLRADPKQARRLILTASGGPFRTWTAEQMAAATPKMALAHPTWEMGPKITIDSATMMNKALEVIEARWLFDMPAEAIEVVVHPQSVVHSLVEFRDGSVVAQLSPPDMRMPIQYALTYPRRLPGVAPSLDRDRVWELSLQPVDRDRFPAIGLGFDVAAAGGTAGAVINAANEEAVGLFLNSQIRFTEIVPACRRALEHHTHEPDPPLERLLELDRWARSEVRRMVGRTGSQVPPR